MEKREYKHHEWITKDVIINRLILDLQKEYQESGRNINESDLEKMDFLIPLILSGEYYMLTTIPIDVLAAHYACFLISENDISTEIELKGIIYDAIRNLWNYISETECVVYKVLSDEGNMEHLSYINKKTMEYLEWYSLRCPTIKRKSYSNTLRAIIAELIYIIFTRKSAPEILCKCL